ncbi:MAG: ABC transporter permease [Bacteroidota bacterium]
MFSNYFKIAFRNLWRNKAFSAINIFGLAIGIATCLVILMFVQNELSYDRFNKKADRTARIIFIGQVQGEKMKEASVMPPVAKALLSDYPEVEEATRLKNAGSPIINYADKSFREGSVAFVDSNFFSVFTLPLIAGDTRTALLEPNTVVITEATAKKYFGKEDAIGKVLFFKEWNSNYKVTGVMKKIPVNSHFHFDFFASMSGFEEAKSSSWMSSNFYTYLVLRKGADYKQLQSKLPGLVSKYIGPQMQQAMGLTLEQFRKNGSDIGFMLEPLTSIHLKSDTTSELEPRGDIRYVYIFSAIALFMLLIACINFMNLSTASAAKRAREVGIRKVMGSVKLQLVKQFLIESMLITVIALLIALTIAQLVLPLFNNITGKALSLNFSENVWLLPSLLLLGIVTGFIAGSYPAFFLSSFNPATVLKGKLVAGKKTGWLRSGLVVFQFCISIVLIVGTAVVYLQLSYIQNKNLGYEKERVLILPETYLLGQKEAVLKQKIKADTRVSNVTSSGYLPAGPSNGNNFFIYAQEEASQIKTLRYDVEDNYISTLGMEIVHGRNFSPEFATDSNGIILNETAARALGWEKNAIGKTVKRRENTGAEITYNVIGVVKDFHFKSLHERISPLVMTLSRNSGTLIIKTKTAEVGGLLATLKNEWDNLNPETPFSYSFLDERFDATYREDKNTGMMLGIFAGLTIFVACLGLFGLATFTANQRTKEIGIRKVLGASVTGIVSLLSTDFLKLVCIAFVVAVPVAWLVMNRWLQDFAYRIDIPWQAFVIAAIAAISITLFTVSYQAIKSALANPVKSLRSE